MRLSVWEFGLRFPQTAVKFSGLPQENLFVKIWVRGILVEVIAGELLLRFPSSL